MDIIFPNKQLIYDFSGDIPYAREPVLGRMPDGSLSVAFLTGGTHEPSTENCVFVSRSTDDGLSWEKPSCLFDLPERAVWATEICTDTEVPFMAVQTFLAENDYRELTTYRSFTYDNGQSWSSPVSIPGIRGSVVRTGLTMSNGELLFPIYWGEVAGDLFAWRDVTEFDFSRENLPYRCGVAISSDRGKNFTCYGNISKDVFSLWEPAVAEIEPGHLLMYMRPNGVFHRYIGAGQCEQKVANLGEQFIYKSESYDFGRTWTPAEKTDIPNPGSLIVLKRVNDKLILINNFDHNERINLKLMVSRDGGQTWEDKLLFENGEYYFYPNVLVDNDKRMLYIAYENAHQHYITKLPFEALD